MRNQYKKIAIWLCLCLIIGLLPYGSKAVAASNLVVRLVITDHYVTKKTYNLKKGKHRQLQIDMDNSFGDTTFKFTSKKPKIASVTDKGYITAKKKGTAKIRVRVTCTSGKKSVTGKTWVKINVIPKGASATATDVPVQTAIVDTSFTPAATSAPVISGPMQATLMVNGVTQASFAMTILDNACGRALYNSLPKVLYFEDRDKNTKTASESDYTIGYTRNDEYSPGTLEAGDFMLYGVDRYELAYQTHSTGYSYTRLGRVLDTTGLATALGSGGVSVTIIKSSTPTVGPSASAAAGATAGSVTPPVSVTPTASVNPAATVSPGASRAPGASTTPRASVSPGSTSSAAATATAAPTPYSGSKFMLTINGQGLPFAVDTGSTAAAAFYGDLKSGKQTYTMILNTGDNNRYFANLNKQYNESTATSPGQWPAGSLVLMGTNEITVFLSTTANTSGYASTILGRIDSNSLPAGSSVSGFLRTHFAQSAVVVEFSAE